jgi:hypothetical protein
MLSYFNKILRHMKYTAYSMEIVLYKFCYSRTAAKCQQTVQMFQLTITYSNIVVTTYQKRRALLYSSVVQISEYHNIFYFYLLHVRITRAIKDQWPPILSTDENVINRLKRENVETPSIKSDAKTHSAVHLTCKWHNDYLLRIPFRSRVVGFLD